MRYSGIFIRSISVVLVCSFVASSAEARSYLGDPNPPAQQSEQGILKDENKTKRSDYLAWALTRANNLFGKDKPFPTKRPQCSTEMSPEQVKNDVDTVLEEDVPLQELYSKLNKSQKKIFKIFLSGKVKCFVVQKESEEAPDKNEPSGPINMPATSFGTSQ